MKTSAFFCLLTCFAAIMPFHAWGGGAMILFFDGDCATCGAAGAEAGAGGIGGAAGAGAGAAAGAGAGLPGGLLAAGGAGAAGLAGGPGATGSAGAAGTAGLAGLGNPLVSHINSVLTPPGILSELALNDIFSLPAEAEQGSPITSQVSPQSDASDLDVEDLLDDSDDQFFDGVPPNFGLSSDEGGSSLTGITDPTFTGGSQEVATTSHAPAQTSSAPEPSSLLVWVLGAAGVAGVRRRRSI